MEERGLSNEANRLMVFKEIAEALNEANDVSAAMEAILPKLGEALGLKTAWAFRYDACRRSFVEVGASKLPPALACCNEQPLRTGWCECQERFVHGNLNEAVNIVRCSRLRDAQGDTFDLRFHASIPLCSKDEPLGILNVAAPGRTVFTAEALAFLETVGQQVAVAVDRARILQSERARASSLHKLASVASAWTLHAAPKKLLQQAVEAFVEAFHYPACGIVTMLGTEGDSQDIEVISVAECSDSAQAHAYVYETAEIDKALSSVLLAEAKSVVSMPLPLTHFHVRMESPLAHAFDWVDEEVLQTFAWHLAAAYVNAQLYAQGMHDAHWRERRRIAADLHDAVSQRLFSAQLLLRTATTQMPSIEQSEAVTHTLARVTTLLAESQAEMRDLIRTLRPLAEGATLLQALRKRVRTLEMQTDVRILLDAPDELAHEPTAKLRAALLAIADEALHNAFKHAAATTIVVAVRLDGLRLSLQIQDDGIGFVQARGQRGLGLRTMAERAESVGARMDLSCTPGVGTRVCVDALLMDGDT
jgi:signal transduction histidine kinase